MESLTHQSLGLAMGVPHTCQLLFDSFLSCVYPQFPLHNIHTNSLQCHGSRQTPHCRTDYITAFLPCSYSKANILKTTHPEEHTVNAQPQEPPSSADLTGTARFQLGLWLLARMHPRASPGNRRGSRVMKERAEGGHHSEVSLYMEHSPSPGYSIEMKQEAGGYN